MSLVPLLLRWSFLELWTHRAWGQLFEHRPQSHTCYFEMLWLARDLFDSHVFRRLQRQTKSFFEIVQQEPRHLAHVYMRPHCCPESAKISRNRTKIGFRWAAPRLCPYCSFPDSILLLSWSDITTTLPAHDNTCILAWLMNGNEKISVE